MRLHIVVSVALSLVLAVLSPGAAPRALATPAGSPVVAVLYFDYDGTDPELGLLRKGLANMLISDLSRVDAIRVVERERLESVLGELKLQGTAKIDPASAVKAGKLLGARFLVLGGYFEAMHQLRVDIRIVDVKTGSIVSSAGATGKRDDFLALEQELADQLRSYLAKVPRGQRAPRPRSAPAKLKAKTVAEYGRALEAIDAGDRKAAAQSLKKVIAEAPDFTLATADLDRLMK